jgi:RecB family exonuclease
LPHRAQASVLSSAEELDARALAALLAATDELAQLGERLDGGEVLALLDRLELRPPARPQPGAVLLADPLAIRARRFRAVFVYGLSENEFPQLGSGEPFLSDERRRELAAASGLVLPAAEDAIERERYLLYACVSRATERIAFSYRSSDEEGNLVLPSPFIADLAELFAADWFERRRRRLLADVVWPGGEAPTARERARAAAAGGPRLATDPAVRQLGEIALRHVRHSEVVSGGALEHFADCPIKWFVERELSPERFEPEPDALARGSFMHLVLEEVIGRLDGPVTAASLPDALRMLEDVLAEIPASVAPGRSDAVRSAALRAIEADLRRYLEHEAREGSRWQPDGLELRFGFEGEDGSLPAVNLGDRVRLRGVIDRVDVDVAAGGGSDDADGARRAIVRDYKSGSTRPAWAAARWEADRQLQVALYMLAVRELLGVQPVAGVYQPLGGGDLRPRGAFLEGLELGGRLVPNDARTQEELDTLLDSARERAVAIAAALREGELEPCPSTCSRDGCMYPGICRSG